GNGVLASPAQGNRYTELLFPDGAGTGINLSATKVYYFNGGIWKQVGQGSVNRGDDVLPLNSYFVVRQNVPTNSTMNSIGAVVVSRLALSLRAQAATEQDNSVGLIRASAVTLNNSGLISSGAFAASPLPGTRTDELLTFDNTVAQKNKSSSAVYYYWNSGWRRVGSGSADFGAAQVFTPGAGFIIRKATNATSVVWTNAP
ncbi:MAG: TIGR02597 family protein, partial [Limisphaerales bacterium]